MVEINESERKKEKWIKRNEDNLRDLQDSVNCPNIWIIGVPEEDKKKDHEKILEEIIVENFPKMGKEIITQVQETQRVPNSINPRWNTPRHILIKLTQTNIKSSKGKTTNNTQGDSHKDNSWSFNRNTSGQEGMAGHTQSDETITYSPDYCTKQGSHSNMKEKSKALQTSKNWENLAPPNQLSNKR